MSVYGGAWIGALAPSALSTLTWDSMIVAELAEFGNDDGLPLKCRHFGNVRTSDRSNNVWC